MDKNKDTNENYKEDKTLSENLLLEGQENIDSKKIIIDDDENFANQNITLTYNKQTEKISVLKLKKKRTKLNYCFFLAVFFGVASLLWQCYGVYVLVKFAKKEEEKHYTKADWIKVLTIWLFIPSAFIILLTIAIICLIKYRNKTIINDESRLRKKTNIVKKFNF